MKLGTKGLEMVSKIDWKAADAEKQAVVIFNQGIVDYVTAYQQGGTDAMGNVLDKKQEKSRAQEYRTLLAHSPYLVDYVQEFNDYLAAWPKGKLAGADDVLYWTKDTFGVKPVVAAYHATFYKSPRGALISTKLLGATHFFNAGLEILAGVPTADGKGLYLLDLYRTRLDPPTGALAGVLMGKVRDGIETGVKENLKTARGSPPPVRRVGAQWGLHSRGGGPSQGECDVTERGNLGPILRNPCKAKDASGGQDFARTRQFVRSAHLRAPRSRAAWRPFERKPNAVDAVR